MPICWSGVSTVSPTSLLSWVAGGIEKLRGASVHAGEAEEVAVVTAAAGSGTVAVVAVAGRLGGGRGLDHRESED